MMRVIYLSLSLLFLGSQLGAQGAIWYVDNVAVGANTGTTWANAWKTFAAIQWSLMRPGDTLCLSGGPSGSSKTYTEVLQIGVSGTASARFTVTLDAANPSHNGTVILDSNYINAAGRNYVTVSGNVNGQRNMLLSNFYSTQERTWGNKVVADSTIGFLMEYVVASNVNQMVSLVGSSGFVIQYCIARDIRGDAAIRAVNCYGGWDSNLIQYNDIEIAHYVGSDPTLIGSDGVQGSDGLTLRYNKFSQKNVTYPTSTQHPDYTQLTGNYLKIYGNEFLNIGDSANDFDWWANPTPHDIWIYNNLYHITGSYDPYPEFIRFYASAGKYYTSLTNFKVWNNTFVDDSTFGAFRVAWGGASGSPGSPVLSGVEIKNNVFVNCGVFDIPAGNSNLTPASLGFSNNLFSPGCTMNWLGTSYNASSWSAIEPTRIVGTPSFVSYTAFNAANDFHLTAPDSHGINLSAYFTTDKDGRARPASGAWDAGAYASGTSIPIVQQPPTVNAGSDAVITLPVNSVSLIGTAANPNGGAVTTVWSQVSGPGSVSFGGITALATQASFPAVGSYTLRLTATAGSLSTSDDVVITVNPLVQPPTVNAGPDMVITIPANSVALTGTATNPNGGAVTTVWSQVSGPGSVSFANASALTTQASFSNAGSYTLRLTATAGSLSGSDDVIVTVNPQLSGLAFQAGSGSISAPFTIINGIVSQQIQTTAVLNSGRAAYPFVVADAGNYIVNVVLNAPGDASNSLFINIDDEPVDPTMIWDIPVTNGFESRPGAWRGGGTFDANEFAPKIFTLSAGTHTLIIRGRESNVELSQIEVAKQGKPKGPSNLHRYTMTQ